MNTHLWTFACAECVHAGRDLAKGGQAGRGSLLERLQAFQVDLARPAPGGAPAFPLLVHKLQDALSATEDFPVNSAGPTSAPSYARFSDPLSGVLPIYL